MEELKRIRESKGLSQAKLAQLAELNPVTVHRIEHGHKSPTVKTLESLAQVLGVEVADLFPKPGRRSSREPSLLNGLEEERRPPNYRTCAEALERLCSHWQGRLTSDGLDQRSLWEFGITTEYFILPVIEQIFDAELAELKEKGGGSPARGGASTYPDSLMWPAIRHFMDVFFAVATAYEREFGEPARVVYLDEFRKVRERLERKAGVA